MNTYPDPQSEQEMYRQLLQNYEADMIDFISLVVDPSVTLQEFQFTLEQLIMSNVNLFDEMFGKEFYSWLEWMQKEDAERFNRILVNTLRNVEDGIVEYLSRFCVLEKVADLKKELKDQIQECRAKELFLSAPYFSHRVEIFITEAKAYFLKW
jgi:hypothetical protein